MEIHMPRIHNVWEGRRWKFTCQGNTLCERNADKKSHGNNLEGPKVKLTEIPYVGTKVGTKKYTCGSAPSVAPSPANQAMTCKKRVASTSGNAWSVCLIMHLEDLMPSPPNSSLISFSSALRQGVWQCLPFARGHSKVVPSYTHSFYSDNQKICCRPFSKNQRFPIACCVHQAEKPGVIRRRNWPNI